ncbi:MAG TPA: toll/interleukin-1 receptor domain-containing protein, partial [Nevskiaceae bacterium]|nr:toll/interleukin-1 receptor domain-containing protein [Nevskiaceae bacterium]
MPETAGHRYWGFLSYSHADEAAAVRLHRALESYVLPRRLRRAHGLPRRLTPIFRDVDELEAASGLNTRLQDALDQSRWLILLCSPAAAASKYVNAEVEYFLQRHGAARVLCVLAGGEPPECFPPAIRALPEEPLAADLRPGRDAQTARLKLVAALAGVGFTELRNREAQR